MCSVINKQHYRIQQTVCVCTVDGGGGGGWGGGGVVQAKLQFTDGRKGRKGGSPRLMADLRSNGGRSPVVGFPVFQLCCLSTLFKNAPQED